jgi:uncharacterized protein
MTQNLLKHEASPYLLQHRDNPVHWRPWGLPALEEAKRDNKPILLSVGYAACHWCHVMAHESFEDQKTAAVMNRLFVNIKVDREERPEIDQIYMAALHQLGEQGGWPLTMFLTPDAAPIWGGTYFPPTAGYGRPAFVDVLNEVSRIFREEPDKVDASRNAILERLSRSQTKNSTTLDVNFLDRAAKRLLELMDRTNGGINGTPKFPQTSLLELLWRAGERTKNRTFQEVVLTTLRNISAGGIYDHIGGGFARYSTDAKWLVPHFEKMLYDNAQLIELLALASIKTNEPLFRIRIEQTIAWLEREMAVEDGAYAASLDADSEGREGKTYVWTHSEIVDILGPLDGAFLASIYDITPGGNWEGASIPNRLSNLHLKDAETEQRLEQLRHKLLEKRDTRGQPGRDDKILTDWNGLAIAAIATAGALLKRPDWIAISRRTYQRALDLMSTDDRLAHSYRAGKRIFPGFATDYAAIIKAALSLHAATQERPYLADAERFAASLRAHHWDERNPGYFLTAIDADHLILRPRANIDEATPSANSQMGANLARLWRLTGNDDYRRDLDDILQESAGAASDNLFAATGTLNALDLRLNAVEIIIAKPPGTDADVMLDEIHRLWSPNLVLSVHDDLSELHEAHPASGKLAVDGNVTAYVCRGETCSLPVTNPSELADLL